MNLVSLVAVVISPPAVLSGSPAGITNCWLRYHTSKALTIRENQDLNPEQNLINDYGLTTPNIEISLSNKCWRTPDPDFENLR
jgi:hypothetical protein